MKKTISFIVAFFCVYFSFCENLNGFYGIPFGGSSQEAILILDLKGWQVSDQKEEKIRFTKHNGKFAILGADEIVLEFYQDMLFKATVSYQPGYDIIPYRDFKEVCDAIVKKYELSQGGNPNTFLSKNKNEFYALLYADTSAGYILTFTDVSIVEQKRKDEEKLRQQKIEADI